MNLIEKSRELAKSALNKELLEQYWQQFQLQLKTLWAKLHDLSGTNWELALYHFNKFNLDDAIFRFRFVLFLTPNKHQALYFLGRCYFEKNKLTKARIFLEKYLLSTDQDWRSEAQYCLHVIKGEYSKLTEIPLRIVQSNFDRIAQVCDVDIIYESQQIQHEILFSLLNKQVQNSEKPLGNCVLDLGCGIGAFGELCRTTRLANNIVGVDISAQMLELTKALHVDGIQAYSQLHCMDAVAIGALGEQKKYDIIAAVDLLMYYPKPDLLFAAVQKLAKEKAWLAISFKTNGNANNIRFGEITEQFFINTNYVLASAQANGWHLISREDFTYDDSRQGVALLFNNQKVDVIKEDKT